MLAISSHARLPTFVVIHLWRKFVTFTWCSAVDQMCLLCVVGFSAPINIRNIRDMYNISDIRDTYKCSYGAVIVIGCWMICGFIDAFRRYLVVLVITGPILMIVLVFP